MNCTTRRLGGALGVAALGTVLNLGYIGRLSAPEPRAAAGLAGQE
jgi:hypothetical protein